MDKKIAKKVKPIESKKGSEFVVNNLGILILILLGLAIALIVLWIFGGKLFDNGTSFFRKW